MYKKIEKENETWIRQRIQQLRNQLDEISGGTALFGRMESDELPLEMELQFLEHVVSFEIAADTTWKKQLVQAGYTMPAPDTLSDEAVAVEVWEVLQRLGEMHCYLDATDHLSDQELYEKLYDILDEPTEDYRMMGEGASCYLELLLPGEDEDDQIWLKYFAGDETRQMWHREFGIKLPPKEQLPYDRDRLLPRRTVPHV